jgi:hypothetical protein
MSDLGFHAGLRADLVIIGAYVFFIGRRQAALRRQVEVLQVEVNEVAEVSRGSDPGDLNPGQGESVLEPIFIRSHFETKRTD